MSLFRLDASIREEGSISRAIADIVEEVWREERPDAPVVRRHVGVEPLPAEAWGQAVTGSWVPAESRTPAQREAIALSATLVDELIDAEALLFAVPLYNYGISQHFKAWVDMIISDPRMAGPIAEETIGGKPAVLVVVRGGGYGEGTPREGWDHATAYIRRVLEDLWHLDVRIVETELTLADVVPAMESLRGVAAELRQDAERTAAEHGKHLTSLVRS
jgi:FMN-dependent NADH-azoreductase